MARGGVRSGKSLNRAWKFGEPCRRYEAVEIAVRFVFPEGVSRTQLAHNAGPASCEAPKASRRAGEETTDARHRWTNRPRHRTSTKPFLLLESGVEQSFCSVSASPRPLEGDEGPSSIEFETLAERGRGADWRVNVCHADTRCVYAVTTSHEAFSSHFVGARISREVVCL